MSGPTEAKAAFAARPQDRGVARKLAFLEAARAVFLEQGYEAASVNEIVRRAGGSLATLYAQYGNKEGLFHAVMAEQHERFYRAMTLQLRDDLPLERGLQVIGEYCLRALLEPEFLGFHRLIIIEGWKFPKQTQALVATVGAERSRSQIADFLRRCGIKADDYDRHAALLIALWRSKHHYAALASSEYKISDEEITSHVAACNAIYLNGAQSR